MVSPRKTTRRTITTSKPKINLTCKSNSPKLKRTSRNNKKKTNSSPIVDKVQLSQRSRKSSLSSFLIRKDVSKEICVSPQRKPVKDASPAATALPVYDWKSDDSLSSPFNISRKLFSESPKKATRWQTKIKHVNEKHSKSNDLLMRSPAKATITRKPYYEKTSPIKVIDLEDEKSNNSPLPSPCKISTWKQSFKSPKKVTRQLQATITRKPYSPEKVTRGTPIKVNDLEDEKSINSPLPCPFKMSVWKPSSRSPKKVTRRTPKKKNVDYHFALDKILNEIEDQKKKDEKMKKIEKNLHDLMLENNRSQPLKKICSFENDKISPLLQRPSGQIPDAPPGLKILEPTRCFRYFSSVEDIVGCLEEDDSPHVTKLLDLPVHIIPEVIERQGFMHFFLNGSPPPSVLLFLFRLMAVHESQTVVESCKKTIEHYVLTSKGDFRWCPSLGDVISVVINYGSGIRNHCPLREDFVVKEKEMSCTWSPRKQARKYQQIEPSLHVCKCKRKHIKVVKYHNFKAAVEVLGFCIKHWNTYCSVHLSQMILLLLWLSLDQVLILQNVASAIRMCIDYALCQIAEDDWLTQVTYLSKEVASLGGHHHNSVYIIKLLPPNTRGIQLQKSASYTTIQMLLNDEAWPTVLPVVTPKDVLKFLKRNPLLQTEDYYFLYSIVLLVDITVGYNISSSQAIIKAIGDLLMRTYAKINDSFMRMEGTQLKNLIVTIHSKWFFLMQYLPNMEKKGKLQKMKTEIH